MHIIRSASSLIWSHLTKYKMKLTSIHLPQIGFEINKWKRNECILHHESRFWVKSACLNIHDHIWLIVFFARLHSRSFIPSLSTKPFSMEKHLWSIFNIQWCVTFHSFIYFYAERIVCLSILLRHICDFGVKTEQTPTRYLKARHLMLSCFEHGADLEYVYYFCAWC